MTAPLDERDGLPDASLTNESAPFISASSGIFTFVFTDIAGSTRLLDEIGPARYHGVSDDHRRIVRKAIKAYDGQEVDTAGDAFFIAFKSVSAALNATIMIQLALATYMGFDVSGLPVRIGIHTGEAIQTSDGFVGLSVHRAARISAVAHGGQVVVSEDTARAAESDNKTFDFKDLGRHRLKDLSEPQRLFQLMVPGLSSEFTALLTLEAFPTNLPVQLTPFIGREREVEQVGNQLCSEDASVVTLTGPGGVGKTRLALQAAAAIVDRFGDGVFFVGLAPVQSVELALSTIAQTLGIQGGGVQPVKELITHYMHHKSVLVVLDNLEQLAGIDSAIAELVSACPTLKILATSRIVLGIPQEIDFRVDALAVPDADHLPNIATLSSNESVALFVDRARAVKPQFRLIDANAKAVAGICQKLDGLPLAIELAAARIKLFSPQALLDRLGERFSLLSTHVKDLPARQQTIRATIEWSFTLLNERDRKLLGRLSVFRGGCTLGAARAVCDPGGQLNASEGVGTLARNNLLQSRQVGEDTRYYQLELIREFAHEMLVQSSEVQVITRNHTQFFLELIEREEPKFHTRDGARSSTRIEADFANFRVALESALSESDKQTVVRLIGALWRPWFFGWKTAAVKDLLQRTGDLLADPSGVDPHLLVDAYAGLAALAAWAGDRDQGDLFARQLLELSHRHKLTRGEAYALWLLGTSANFASDFDTANSTLTSALKKGCTTHDTFVQGWTLINLGSTCMSQRNYTRALELFNQAFQLSEKTGDINIAAGSARNMGFIALRLDDRTKAISSFTSALQWGETLQSAYMAVSTLAGLASALTLSDPVVAAKLRAKVDVLFDEMVLLAQPPDIELRENTIADLESKLTEQEMRAAWEAGKGLTLDEATVLAVETAAITDEHGSQHN